MLRAAVAVGRESEKKKKRVKKTYADDGGGGDRCVRYNGCAYVGRYTVYGCTVIARGRYGGDARGAPVAADNREIAAVE